MIHVSRIHTALAAATFVAFGLASDAASAAPAGISERSLDVECKAADVEEVFKMLAIPAGRSIALDPCVRGKVDLKMKNTPIPLVFDALALKLRLVYDDDGAKLTVRCQADAATNERLGARVTVAENDAPLDEIAARVAAEPWRDSRRRRASQRPRLTVTLKGAKLSTLVIALGDASGLSLSVANGRLVVAD